jgi:SpoVK/Ycf46/Vps4 family AAA+-type ATPase
LVCKEVTNLGGLVIKFNACHLFIGALKLLKQVQPDVPIVALMEDLDEILRDNNISDVLNLLDGVEATIDNVVYLATTNNPERLHQNIKNRPSRFDRRFEFNEPGLEARKHYLAFLFRTGLTAGTSPGAELVELGSRGDNDLDRWAADTDGFSFAHLKELFVSVVLFGNKYEEVISELGVMRKDLSDEADDEDEDDDDDL